jgi:excisionase family DNA binding protein
MALKSRPREELNTIPQAAQQLNLSNSTIRSWIWQRRIESVRVGRALRIRQSVIDAVIEKSITPANERVAVSA